MPLLSRHQRQRRRENTYWDKVLLHAVQRGAKREARKRLQEDRAFHAIVEEFRVLNEAESVDAVQVLEQLRRGKAKKRFATKRTPESKQTCTKFSQVCLVDAIRSLGVKAPYIKNGPFWALADGNSLLEPFQCLACIKNHV